MAFTEREAAAAAQIAEAQNAFAQHRRAEAAVRALGGDFVWKAEADGDHLHRVSANGEVLKDFGPRSARLEAIANAHEKKKSEAYASLEHWIRERDRMQQLNRAHQVGRLLDTPVKVL